MAVIQISRIQHRRGLRIDLPLSLNDGEFGWAEDTRELFIGNGPASPVGGNTQVLTSVTPASVPQYTYVSNTGAQAITGFEREPFDPFEPSANFPTFRSYQEKFDDYVSVLDYGAIGDGDDDTAAIVRANYDIYDENASPLSVAGLRKYRALYFPAGTYRVTKEVFLYPNTVWLGDGPGRTKIILIKETADAVVPTSEEECVVRTVDSLGQIGAAIDGTAQRDPGNIIISGITFETESSNVDGYTLGQIDVIKLDDAKNVCFKDCDFVGTWMTGNAAFSRCIHIANPGSTVGPFGGYTFSNCLFSNNAYAFRPTADTTNVYVVNSKFDMNHRSMLLGKSSGSTTFPVTSDVLVSLFRVSHSIFENVNEVGMDVLTLGTGNISTYNHYRGDTITDYSIASVRFAGLTDFLVGTDTTSGCVSIGDTFDRTDAYDCSDKFTNQRVQNRSVLNVVMNAQDLFQIPYGFCGDLSVDGTITVTGTIESGGTPAVLPYSIPYTPAEGQAIFFDYAMETGAPDFVYRIGTLHVIHDGSGTNPTGITFSETYTELGGAPSEPVALQAEFSGGNIEVSIITPPGGFTPVFNFLTRTISL